MKRSTLLTMTSIIALYHIIVAGGLLTWFGIFVPTQIHRAISVICGLTLTFLLVRARSNDKSEKVPWYDYVLILSTIISAGYVVFFHDEILKYATYGFLDTKGFILALMLAIPILEAARRKTGIIFPLIILFFVFITVFQNILPGFLYGTGFPLKKLLFSAYVGVSGFFGFTLGVAATILIIFLIFGALFHRAGGGKWLMDLALALTGWSRGPCQGFCRFQCYVWFRCRFSSK